MQNSDYINFKRGKYDRKVDKTCIETGKKNCMDSKICKDWYPTSIKKQADVNLDVHI